MDGGPKGPSEQPGYLSYLLRLWQVEMAGEGERLGGTVWRGSLECSMNGERQGFASLDELFEFLHRQTERVADLRGTQG